jgi:putative phage-type endonuclease
VIQSVSIITMTRDQWLAERRKGIGGSDASAVVGLNPFSTPYTLWANKTGRLPEAEDNEAMRQGRDLEPYVVSRFEEATGKRCRRRNAILRNTEYPWAHANIDREIIGERAGFEAKTTSVLNLRHFKNGEYPAQYYVQCMHYLAVTGWQRWYLGVLILNQAFHVFTIERDQDEIDALMQAEEEFWSLVESDTPPPMDGMEATSEALATVYRDTGGGSVELFGREVTIKAYLDIQAQIKELERDAERYKQILQADLGEAENGYSGPYTVTWKSQSRRTFDAARFAADHPDTDLSPYYNTSSFRKFTIKEIKEAK